MTVSLTELTVWHSHQAEPCSLANLQLQCAVGTKQFHIPVCVPITAVLAISGLLVGLLLHHNHGKHKGKAVRQPQGIRLTVRTPATKERRLSGWSLLLG